MYLAGVDRSCLQPYNEDGLAIRRLNKSMALQRHEVLARELGGAPRGARPWGRTCSICLPLCRLQDCARVHRGLHLLVHEITRQEPVSEWGTLPQVNRWLGIMRVLVNGVTFDCYLCSRRELWNHTLTRHICNWLGGWSKGFFFSLSYVFTHQ